MLKSIQEVGALLQEGILSQSELCAKCLSRAKHLQELNAFVLLLADRISSQGKESDERLQRGVRLSPLDGIPIAVKDNFCVQDVKTTCGSRMLENFIPKYTATVVQRLEAAGATLIGKCNMDEFAMGSGTVDSIHGPTKNPWQSKFDSRRSSGGKANEDDWYITGGSSGGSAVAVATGIAFAALGSDTGGSTRNPASYCGVVGLKPGYGSVSRHGLIPLVNSLDVPGILTRCVDDAALIFDLIAGHDPLDSTTVQGNLEKLGNVKEAEIKKVTVGVPSEYHCTGMSSEILEAWSFVCDLLENSGAKVLQVSLPHTQYSISCYSVLNACEVASNMSRYDGIEFGLRADENRSTEEMFAASRSLGFNHVVRSRILAGNYFLLRKNYEKYFVQALKVRRLISEDFDRAWSSGINILLTPTTLTDAPLYSDFVKQDNRTQCAVQDYCTQPANMAGCPAVTLPIKLSSRGLPLGLQLMAPLHQEHLLLSVAKWIESRVDFPKININVPEK